MGSSCAKPKKPGRRLALETSRRKPGVAFDTDQTIVLVVNNLRHWVFSEAAGGADAAVRGSGYRLVCLDSLGFPGEEQEHLKKILERQPAGAILVSPAETGNLPLCRQVAAAVPTAQILLCHPDIPCDRVDYDQYASGRLAVEHLIELGHRRIGHITYRMDLPIVCERLRAYFDALRSAGLPDPAGGGLPQDRTGCATFAGPTTSWGLRCWSKWIRREKSGSLTSGGFTASVIPYSASIRS